MRVDLFGEIIVEYILVNAKLKTGKRGYATAGWEKCI